MPTPTSPGVVRTYVFANFGPSFTVGNVPQTDDSTQAIEYFDSHNRRVQVRTRLGSGVAPGNSTGNIVRSLATQYRVDSNVLLDGLGRVRASLDPYFASTGSYVDPRLGGELWRGIAPSDAGHLL